VTETWRVLTDRGEGKATVALHDGYVVARIVVGGVPSEYTGGPVRAAIYRACDMAGILGDVTGLAKAAA
jgi:hypothetical protein